MLVVRVLLNRMLMLARPGVLRLVLLTTIVGAAACGDDTPTSPTTTTTPTPASTVAEATVLESFTGTLPVGGFRFYSFEVPTNGTVTVTLNRIGGNAGVPSTVWVGLGVGVPDGTDCPTTTSGNTQSGAGPHISTTLTPGTYCARVYDIGNLAAQTTFDVTIGHP